MLKGIDPLLGPDLLWTLASMGHGDEIVISDANFPGASVARTTVRGTPLRADCDAIRMLEVVLSVLPLDTFDGPAVHTMQVVDDPKATPDVVANAEGVLKPFGAERRALERFAFYDRAKTAFAVLRTAEARPYGNFILRKGVIASTR